MLGRLLRLGLDQDGALEADLVLVLDHHAHEAADLVGLALEVGVEQRLVALAPAPQHVVGAVEAVGDVHDLADLRRGIGEDLGVGIGGGTRHVAAMAEQVGGAPQQPPAGLLHRLFHQVDDVQQRAVGLREVGALRRHVAIMEGEERRAERREEVEGDLELELGPLERIAGLEPRPHQGLAAEWVVAVPVEAVPVAHREAQQILHPPAEHDAVLVVVAEGQRVVALRAFILDLGDVAEEAAHVWSSRLRQPASPAKRCLRSW